MEFPNNGQSFYHRFQGTFLYDSNEGLVHCTGRLQKWLLDHWRFIQSGNSQVFEDVNVTVYHKKHDDPHGRRTAVMVSKLGRQSTIAPFEEFFAQRILAQADLCADSQPGSKNTDSDVVAERIVDFFDCYLRYHGKDDKWVQGGRSYFAERVRHFTRPNATVEFCLPAFPCKSSNVDKVTGRLPDAGEQLALERLHDFAAGIRKLYPPGARVWIISDGHVFSDLIGVDDAVVDTYGRRLKEMALAMEHRRGNTNYVAFRSLVDLFQVTSAELGEPLPEFARHLNIPNLHHHVATEITEEAELCRRMLMTGCGPQRSTVRAKIDSKDSTITALYCGFSRFMLEDLERHPHTRDMTRSQQKRLSSKVAFEMILRNQAYSNLVELLFPKHLRLSIHAHDNAGPKFGIQLFDPTRVRAVETLSSDGNVKPSLDLLHIPTPWHNAVVRLADSNLFMLTKAKAVRAALEQGVLSGGLVQSEDGGGSYFALRTGDSKQPAEVPVRGLRPEGASRGKHLGDAAVSLEKVDATAIAAACKDRTVADPKSLYPWFSTHNTWLGSLRWITSWFWAKTP